MVRSCWKWTLAGAWVWGGVVTAQSPYRVQEAAPAPMLIKPNGGYAAAPVERRIFVDEPGKGKQECRVLHEWITDDGHKAMEVQSLRSGTVSTILMPGPGSVISPNAPAGMSRVFHWENGSPPPGAPVYSGRSSQPVARSSQPVARSVQPAQPPRTFVPAEPVTRSVPVSQPVTKAMPVSQPVTRAMPASQPVVQAPTSSRSFVPSEPPPAMTAPPARLLSGPKPGPSADVVVAEPARTPLWKRLSPGESQPTAAVETRPTTTPENAPRKYQSPVQRGEMAQRSYVPPARRGEYAQQSTTIKMENKPPQAIAQLPPATDLRQSWGNTSGEPVQDPHAKIARQPSSQIKLPQSLENELLASMPKAATRTELPKANVKGTDPLLQPQSYAKRGYFDLPKANAGGSTSPSPLLANLGSPSQSEPGKITAAAAAARPVKPAGSETPGRASTNPQVPLGAASVMAAYGNREGQVIYLPVPVITSPNVQQMPRAPQISSPPPQPPRPVDDASVNAFSSPAAVQMAYGQPQGNAFLPPEQMMAMQQHVMMQQQAAMQQAAMQQQMMVQQQMMHAQMQAQAAQTAMVMPAQPTTVPVGYQTPQPTNAMMVQQLLQTLKEALMPSHREWAAEALGSVDWRTYPQVVDALLAASKQDLAGGVRAACLRSLGRMKVGTAPVISAVQALRADTDPRVRQEADQVLADLGIKPAKEAEIQPASGQLP